MRIILRIKRRLETATVRSASLPTEVITEPACTAKK
jgi:hypothetical protein